MQRRDFSKLVGTGIALPALSQVAGQAPKRIKTALITGAGGAHLNYYCESLALAEEVASVSFCDPSGESSALARKLLGSKLTNSYPDLGSLFRKEKPELALISMEAATSPPAIDAALDAGAFSAVTFECWIYPTSDPAPVWMYVAQSFDGSLESYSLQVRFGLTVLWQTGNLYAINSVATIPLNTWTHIVGTSSVGDGLRLYFNGAQVGTAAGGGPLNLSSPTFTIGANRPGGTSYPFAGRIAQVALYGSVIPASTILDHYRIGAFT